MPIRLVVVVTRLDDSSSKGEFERGGPFDVWTDRCGRRYLSADGNLSPSQGSAIPADGLLVVWGGRANGADGVDHFFDDWSRIFGGWITGGGRMEETCFLIHPGDGRSLNGLINLAQAYFSASDTPPPDTFWDQFRNQCFSFSTLTGKYPRYNYGRLKQLEDFAREPADGLFAEAFAALRDAAAQAIAKGSPFDERDKDLVELNKYPWPSKAAPQSPVQQRVRALIHDTLRPAGRAMEGLQLVARNPGSIDVFHGLLPQPARLFRDHLAWVAAAGLGPYVPAACPRDLADELAGLLAAIDGDHLAFLDVIASAEKSGLVHLAVTRRESISRTSDWIERYIACLRRVADVASGSREPSRPDGGHDGLPTHTGGA